MVISTLSLFVFILLTAISPATALEPSASQAGDTASEMVLLNARLDQLERKIELMVVKIRRLSETSDQLSRAPAASNEVRRSSPVIVPRCDCDRAGPASAPEQAQLRGRAPPQIVGNRQIRVAEKPFDLAADAIRIRIISFGIEHIVVYCDETKCRSKAM